MTYNLYKFLKMAQIWLYTPDEDTEINPDSGDRTFGSWITQLYVMEYKYSMVNSKFQGMPQRKENILNNLKEQIVEASGQVVGQLKRTIGDWLSKHALLSPKTWSKWKG